ncbi:MAG: hypothetical protein A2041_02525 [Bacteroidetes bacterium GWA2_31_9b]|nr:MAG: hypothetical protein A2041_02525 [Bacteroidetes bacterium GWA2_31_9b]
MKLIYLQLLISILIISIFSNENNLTAQNKSDKHNFSDLPLININISDTTDQGYIFLAVNKSESDYLMILDNYLTPVFLKKFNSSIQDFKIQKNGFLSYYQEVNEKFYVLDSAFNIVDSFYIGNDFMSNFHDFKLTDNGYSFLLGLDYQSLRMDTIVEGGNPNATVIGCIIQEYDENKNLIFQWRSWDHYKITDTYMDLTAQIIDYVHGNSIEIDTDSNIIFSARNMSEITKIDRITGEIIWRLGGKNNEFEIIGDTKSFSAQHSVTKNSNGNITLFDNGNFNEINYSRGVEYEIDELNKTITFVNEFRHNPDVFSQIMGNMQNLSNGNKLIGWGTNSNDDNLFLTEFKPDGTPVFELSSPEKEYSYRAFRYPWKTTLFNSNNDTVDFGEVSFGSFANQQIVITNNSENTLELSSYATRGTVFTILNGFPIVIPPKGNKTLDIKFTPSKYGYNLTDVLTLNSDGYDKFGNEQRVAIQVNLKGFSPDINSPEISTYPLNNSTNIVTNTLIEIIFDEPIRFIDNSSITIENIKSSISFTKDEFPTTDVLFDVVLKSDSNKFEIHPLNPLEYNENYLLTIHPYFEDYSDNLIDEKQIHFSTENSTNVNTIPNDVLNIYPNPTNDKITIASKTHLITKIEVCKLNGEIINKISEINKMDIIISLNKQLTGIYVLKITLDNNTIVSKKINKI